MEFAIQKFTLKNEEYKLLLMDKFSLSSLYNNYYGLTEKWKKCYLSLIVRSSLRSL